MNNLKVLELFAGSRSFTQVAIEKGCTTHTTDIEPFEGIDQVCDIFNFDVDLAEKSLGGCPDIIWASPPCTYFSVASIGKHWNKDNTPKTDQAKHGVKVIQRTKESIIHFLEKNHRLVYIIENPRGKLRKLPLLENY